jgi:hypothetical protein
MRHKIENYNWDRDGVKLKQRRSKRCEQNTNEEHEFGIGSTEREGFHAAVWSRPE